MSEPMSNFTPRAQQVLALARKEADRFHGILSGNRLKHAIALRIEIDHKIRLIG